MMKYVLPIACLIVLSCKKEKTDTPAPAPNHAVVQIEGAGREAPAHLNKSLDETYAAFLAALRDPDGTPIRSFFDSTIACGADYESGIAGCDTRYGMDSKTEISLIARKKVLEAAEPGYRINKYEGMTWAYFPKHLPDAESIPCDEEGHSCDYIAHESQLFSAPDSSNRIGLVPAASFVTALRDSGCVKHEFLSAKSDCQWVEVELADGKVGWVAGKDVEWVYSLTGTFAEKNGVWKLVSLISGRE
jgi:hypothetical protein